MCRLTTATIQLSIPMWATRLPRRHLGEQISRRPDLGLLLIQSFRYGHSQVNSHLWRFDRNWTVLPEGHLPLRDSYFAPERVIREGGIDPLLRGFIYQPAQAVDTKVGLCVTGDQRTE